MAKNQTLAETMEAIKASILAPYKTKEDAQAFIDLIKDKEPKQWEKRQDELMAAFALFDDIPAEIK